jgi:hypothetical protein
MNAKIQTKANSTFITRAKIEELLNNGGNEVSILTLSKWLKDSTNGEFTIKETRYTKVLHGRFTGYADNN